MDDEDCNSIECNLRWAFNNSQACNYIGVNKEVEEEEANQELAEQRGLSLVKETEEEIVVDRTWK